jgi:dihydrofolate synthase/folylpolyglutamate synthase
MEAAATLRWLTGLRNLGSRLGIDRMRALSERLGRPERCAPCFHVAGTNGKGSTSAMIEAIQRAHGRRTGLYTSPHLVQLGERLQVDRVPATEARVVALAEELRPHYAAIAAADAGLAPTFFELITAAAWLEFRAARVDVMVLETGLGGRLDATNLCSPEVCVITSIGLDHQEYLGPTLAAIAAEKAGILKPGVPVVVGQLPAEAEAVVVQRAREVGAPVHFVRDRFASGLPETNLVGAHQRWNAGAAWLACELATRLHFDASLAASALQQVSWAGRWQRLALNDGRTLIVDGSHNEEGIRAVEPLLAALRQPTLVVGALGLDRARPLVEAAARHASRLILVRPDNERACTVEELATLVPSTFRGEVVRSTTAELFPSAATCTAPGETVVVLGSLYLVGEVLARHQGVAVPTAAWQDRLPPTR